MDRTKSEKFSPEEIKKVKNLDQELSRLAEKALQPGDYAMVRSYLKKAAESDCIQRDSFGFHPIINDLETAVLVVQEIGLPGKS